jgi:hypothetical protein
LIPGQKDNQNIYCCGFRGSLEAGRGARLRRGTGTTTLVYHLSETWVCWPVCPLACLPLCFSLRLSAYVPVSLSVCLSVCLSACILIGISVCKSVCLPVCLPVCLSVCFYLSVPLFCLRNVFYDCFHFFAFYWSDLSTNTIF